MLQIQYLCSMKRFFLLPALLFCFLTIHQATQARRTRTFSIHNPAVEYYLSHSTSTFSDTPDVLGRSFFDEVRDFRPDQPKSFPLHLTSYPGNSESTPILLEVASDRRFRHIELSQIIRLARRDSFLLRNLIPGTKYYYRITSEGRQLMRGSILATGQIRMIAIDNGFNIRDLGGWKGLGGKTVRYGWLYRGGSLGGTDKDGNESTLPSADQQELHRIGIRAQLDLRAPSNKGKYTGESSLHSYSLGRTTLLDADYCNIMTDYGAYNQDSSIVSDLAWIISQVRQGRPVYFNCRQGADRTGTIAFVIEGLLGCYEYSTPLGANQMAIDYELTGFSQANLVDNWKVKSSHRPASEAYSNQHKLFRQLLQLQANEPDIQLNSLQEKCYYYLNRYFTSNRIPQTELDWFIMHMLGLSEKRYKPYRHDWAK